MIAAYLTGIIIGHLPDWFNLYFIPSETVVFFSIFGWANRKSLRRMWASWKKQSNAYLSDEAYKKLGNEMSWERMGEVDRKIGAES